MSRSLFGLGLLTTVFVLPIASAVEPLPPAAAPEPNRSDEPLAENFSLEAATRFLDQASLHWTQSRKCFACHTNYLYLVAQPELPTHAETHREVRRELEAMVEERWQSPGPRWDAEVVMTAAVLAMHDSATTGKLHATTRRALDRMWSVQRADGGIDWLKCDWPPMESDDDFGAAMLALAVGAAPEDYRRTAAAQAGLEKLRGYLVENPAPTLHHEAMLLWADSYLTDLLTDDQRQASIRKLLEIQQPDGGWNLATLGDWTRADGQPQDRVGSDGYGTGLVIYVLRRCGLDADDPRLQSGITWLKSNQRASGRWFTRSLHKDSKHFISHAGTAMAALAIATCEPVAAQ